MGQLVIKALRQNLFAFKQVNLTLLQCNLVISIGFKTAVIYENLFIFIWLFKYKYVDDKCLM